MIPEVILTYHVKSFENENELTEFSLPKKMDSLLF